MTILISLLFGFILFMFWLIVYIRLFYSKLFFNLFASMLFWLPCVLTIIILIIVIIKLIHYQNDKDKITMIKGIEKLRKNQKDNIQMTIINDQKEQDKRLLQLQKIQQALKAGNYKEAKELFSLDYDKVKKNKSIHYCDNAYVNAVLYNKKIIAKEMGIKMTYNIMLPKEDELDVIDLPAVLFNILDNAIRACQNSDDKYINLQIKYNQQYLSIYQKNASSLKKEEEIQGLHGYGLQIVEEIVGKYDGICTWDDHDDYFESKIMLKYKGA